MCAAALTLPRKLTPEQYLDQEEKASFKSEYLAGYVYAMAGGSYTHHRINVNMAREVSTRLKGRDCEAMPSELRVWMPAVENFLYPDGAVICGSPRFRGGRNDVVENPTVVFEILSESTEKYDRGAKFHSYQTIPELRQYVLISQNQPMVEVFTRDGDRWILRTYRGLDSVAEFESIDVQLPMRELYDRVEFPPPAPMPQPEDRRAVTE